jgi:hypothetical protein
MCAEPTPACLSNTCCKLEHPLLSNSTTNNNSNSKNKDLYNEDDDRNNSVKSHRQDWDIVILNKQNTAAIKTEKQSPDNSSPSAAVAVMVVAKQIFIEDYLSSTSVC